MDELIPFEEAEKLLHIRIAYELYKRDWCMQRGWNFNEVQKAFDNGEEYNGQMFVCQEEFADYEYQYAEYIKYLFSDEFDAKLKEKQ